MKPKRAKVTFEERICRDYVAKYQCPKCKIYFESYVLRENVTRFLCDCGQEIIVMRKIVKEEV